MGQYCFSLRFIKFACAFKGLFDIISTVISTEFPICLLKNNQLPASDVAKLAGVSQSTVSRVFIDGSSVSAAAREKVFAAAKELNYRPNAFARSLTTNESKLIGLVFPDSDYPIHMETLQRAQ